ncbi:hypothetical protein ACFX2I_017507 [Malus domestica]
MKVSFVIRITRFRSKKRKERNKDSSESCSLSALAAQLRCAIPIVRTRYPPSAVATQVKRYLLSSSTPSIGSSAALNRAEVKLLIYAFSC